MFHKTVAKFLLSFYNKTRRLSKQMNFNKNKKFIMIITLLAVIIAILLGAIVYQFVVIKNLGGNFQFNLAPLKNEFVNFKEIFLNV